MTELMKQALIKETERHIAQDILYDDVYVGPFTEKDGVDCAVHAVDWYRNNVWHPASEEPKDKAQCLVITKRKSKDIVTYSYQFFYKGHVIAYPCRLYALTNIVMWADMEDLLPDSKGGES